MTEPRNAGRCGYTIIDADGEEQPCDRPATGWRWYQDCDEHEDALDVACDRHANEGGRRIAAAEGLRLRADTAEARLAAVEKLAEEWRYKGEFGWGAWQEGHGPDQEGWVLDQAATELRAALGLQKWAHRCGECRSAEACDAQRRCIGRGSVVSDSPEPKRCEHGYTERHQIHAQIGVIPQQWCPGPVGSETDPETAR